MMRPHNPVFILIFTAPPVNPEIYSYTLETDVSNVKSGETPILYIFFHLPLGVRQDSTVPVPGGTIPLLRPR
jgi:hypothetical protein